MRVCGASWQSIGLDVVGICMLGFLVGFRLMIRVGLFLPVCVCGSFLSCLLLLVSPLLLMVHCCVIVWLVLGVRRLYVCGL